MTEILSRPDVDAIRSRLNALHAIPDNTWRRIALMDAYKGIPPGTLCSYANGRPITNNEHRRILGLSQIVEINGKKFEFTEVG